MSLSFQEYVYISAPPVLMSLFLMLIISLLFFSSHLFLDCASVLLRHGLMGVRIGFV
jgi:hypothetical protein